MLRRELPKWEWSARRAVGLGWYYVGELAFSRVEVRACSQLCGPGEDDFKTVWRVSEGNHSEPFDMFWLAEREATRRAG